MRKQHDSASDLLPDVEGRVPGDVAELKASQPRCHEYPPPVVPGRGLGRIATFFVVVCALALSANAIITAGFRRIKTGDFGVTNRVVNGQVNAEILISGSSRALTHYDSRIIQEATGKRTFNIGLNGSQTDTQVAYLKAYLARNAKPSLIIHNLDLFSFVTSREIYDVAQFMPYLDNVDLYAGVSRVYTDAWKWQIFPLHGFLTQDLRFTWLIGLKGFFGWQPPETRFQGFQPRYTPWTGDFERYRESNPDGIVINIERRGVEDLMELAETCKLAGVPLLFVYSPEYVEMQAMERNRAEIFAEFDKVCRRFGTPLWDYSDSVISNDRSYFYNSQHLNAAGARVFTQEIALRVRQVVGSEGD